jgi:hypothetical protein
MVWNTMRELGGLRRWLFIGLMVALGGCAQLANQYPPAQPTQQQSASTKLPPF